MGVDTDTRRAIHAATVGELVWLGAPGRPDARPVTPLLLGDEPAVAFPYADADLARRVAGAPAAALIVSDNRLTGRGWRPVAVTGRPRLIDDRDGAVFSDRLLAQELRKYPPARALIDSPLLRREHWWYLPRLVVVIDVDAAHPVGARAGGAGEVLAVAGINQPLYVDTVDRHAAEPGLRLASSAGRPAKTGPALLLGHDFSVPDLECWTPWTTRGRLAGDATFTVEESPARTVLAPPPGLWRRLLRHRRLERACRSAIDGAGPP